MPASALWLWQDLIVSNNVLFSKVYHKIYRKMSYTMSMLDLFVMLVSKMPLLIPPVFEPVQPEQCMSNAIVDTSQIFEPVQPAQYMPMLMPAA